ncbi:MAG TPA: LysR family transcriptional regulator [Solirubrobacteraceae bacterium]|nr:LysR family transcriptional regulator [Solirubrobacteraceae bacterium]
MLNVHRLTVLHAVVTEGSVTGAAAELNYTPSAVSQHIAALERETGARLLERVGRRVRPTPAGALLAGYAGEILNRVADAETALAALTDGRTGRIRLASFGSAGTGLVPPAVAHFRGRHPEIDIQLTLAEQPEALAALRADQADLIVILLDVEESGAESRPAPAGKGLDWHPLLLDPYFVALPCAHPLTALGEVPLPRLAGERLVSGDRNRVCPIGEAFERICAAAGFRPRFEIEVDDYPTVQSLVAAGLGAAAIPLLGLSPAVHEGVAVRPLVQPSLTRRIFAVSRSGRSDDPLIAGMIACLQRAADELLIPDAVPAVPGAMTRDVPAAVTPDAPPVAV